MTDSEPTQDTGAREAREAGMGRVVYDDRPARDTADDAVEEGSEESFPASDPPAFTGDGPAATLQGSDGASPNVADDAADPDAVRREAGSLSVRPSA